MAVNPAQTSESFETAQKAAHRHLWMHFAELSKYDGREIPTIIRGEGSYVFDAHGQRFLDALSSLYCVNVGHGRKEIADAVGAQMAQLSYYSTWNYAHPRAIELAERIATLAPGDLNRVFFTSGGSESVESAWKMARQYHRLRGKPEKTKIVSRLRAYHGTTMGALSITGIPSIQEPFLPLVPGVLHGPTVDPYHADADPVQHSLDCADGIGKVIQEADPDTVAAVIIEPVQNSGGCLTPEPEYFARLRAICDEHDVLLISDETICSWGRLGAWFGAEYFGYEPDILTTAKGLTSAYVPMGAVLASDRVAEPFLEPGQMFAHGLTFGGHPLAAAAALANIEIIEKEELCALATDSGAYFREVLESLKDIPIVGDVRGAGLFMAVELVADQPSKEPLPKPVLAEMAARVPGMLYERGLICRAMHRGAPVIQFAPPLVIDTSQIDELGDAMRSVLGEMADLAA
jgi:adenosylmethionine-8-amino-7-oxononanoate aminotransferase